MERFKRFTDKATGVNPFVKKPMRISPIKRIVNALFLPIRAFLLVVLLAALFVMQLLRVPFANWRYFNGIFGFVHFSLIRVTLWVLSNLIVFDHIYPLAPLDSIPTIAPGDVVAANCQSPIDLLVLSSLSQWCRVPVEFVFPEQDGTDPQALVPQKMKLFAAAAQMFRSPRYTSPEQFKEYENLKLDLRALQNNARKRGTALVVFPEGTTTNGAGILAFPRICCTPSLHLVALHYDSPAIPVVCAVSPFAYFAQISAGLPPFGFLAHPMRCHVSLVRPSAVPIPHGDAFESPETMMEIRRTLCKVAILRDRSIVCCPVSQSLFDKTEYARQLCASK